MKLSDLNIKAAVSDGVWIDIVAPAAIPHLNLAEGDKTGLEVKVRSTDSREYRRALAKLTNERLRKRAAQTVDADEADQKAVDLLIAMTVDWRGFKHDNGEPMLCTEQNMRAVYSDVGYRWLRDQVDTAASDRSRFFTSSSPASSDSPSTVSD